MKHTTTTTATNPFKVGDIVSTSWGYSMIIVDFYQVVRVTASKVELRELEQKAEGGGWSGKCVPIPGAFVFQTGPFSVKEGQLCKVHGNCVKIPSYPGSGDFNYAHKWNGQPEFYDHCD